jgi:hypothetical protein
MSLVTQLFLILKSSKIASYSLTHGLRQHLAPFDVSDINSNFIQVFKSSSEKCGWLVGWLGGLPMPEHLMF